MASILRICCGEGEEETKFGGLIDPAQLGWTDPVKNHEKLQNIKRIRSLENKISLMNKARPKERQVICGQPLCVREAMTFNVQFHEKTEVERRFITEVLKSNFLFIDMIDSEYSQLVDAMQKETASAGIFIIEQGGIGDFFYIVESGTVLYADGETQVGEAQRGDSFGELSLLYDCPRAVSCVAKTVVSTWKVDQQTFRCLLARHTQSHQIATKDLLRKIDLFKGLDENSLCAFTDALTRLSWEGGARIVQKGEEGSVFYIIESGSVKVHDIGIGDSQFEDQILGEGEWFGERALVTGEPRAANVTAIGKVTMLAIDRETFERTLGPMKDAIDIEMKIHFLKSIPLIGNGGVTDPEIKQLAKLVEEICYRKSASLFQAGSSATPQLFIIRHGRILVYNKKDETLHTLDSGDYLDEGLLEGTGDENESNVTCESDVTAWTLSRAKIESVIGDLERLGKTKSYSKSKAETHVAFDDLVKIKVLGVGAFGEVWLVSHSSKKGTSYALKAINKRKLLDSKQEGGVIREKELLSSLNHPFILQLVSSFQDDLNLYLLLPVIPGGELFSVLQKQKRKGSGIASEHAAFYAACIVEALGHFHQRSICYRDLKLENVLVDEFGYCKIVDLGFAKVVVEKTYTLVGTPEYIAPEIILSKGHDKAVDFWSLGVLIYELLVGVSPFFEPHSSQMEMFKRIVTLRYQIPAFVEDHARNLITELIMRKPSDRLGNRSSGYLEVKAMAWFKANGIDFRSLIRKNQAAPWVPNVKDSLDSSNFDSFDPPSRGRWRRLTSDEQQIFKDF